MKRLKGIPGTKKAYIHRQILLKNLRRDEGSRSLHSTVFETSEGFTEGHGHIDGH